MKCSCCGNDKTSITQCPECSVVFCEGCFKVHSGEITQHVCMSVCVTTPDGTYQMSLGAGSADN